MNRRARRITWIALVGIALVVAARLFPHLESDRSLKLLRDRGATFELTTDGRVLWMILPPAQATDETLLLLKNRPGLAHLTLKDCNITTAGLQNLGVLKDLELLDLSHTSRLAGGLREIREFSSLANLKLADCPWVDDDQLAAVAELSNLSSLDLRATSVSDACVDHLIRLDKLADIRLDDCPHITDDGILRLAERPQLVSLSVAGTSMSIGLWNRLATLRPGLRVYCPLNRLLAFEPLLQAGGTLSSKPVIVLSNMSTPGSPGSPATPHDEQTPSPAPAAQPRAAEVADPDESGSPHESAAPPGSPSESGQIDPAKPDPPPEQPKLESPAGSLAESSFEIVGPVAPDVLARLAELDSLISLTIRDCPVNDDDLRWLRRLTRLRKLDLSGTRVSDAIVESISRSPLTNLNLSRTQVTDRGLAELARLPMLHTLAIGNTAVTDTGLAELGTAPALGVLVVDGAPIHGEGLAGLSRAQTIRELSLKCDGLQEESLPHLANFKSLTTLSLGSSVGDAGVRHLAGLPGLTSLTLHATRLSDVGPSEFEKLKALRSLRLTGSASNELLGALARLTDLKMLDLSHADCSEHAVAALAAACPKLCISK